MGQAEIVKFLEKQDKPLTRSEIAKGMKESPTKVSRDLRKLIEFKEIDFLELDYLEAKKNYGLKRRVRIYFIDVD